MTQQYTKQLLWDWLKAENRYRPKQEPTAPTSPSRAERRSGQRTLLRVMKRYEKEKGAHDPTSA